MSQDSSSYRCPANGGCVVGVWGNRDAACWRFSAVCPLFWIRELGIIRWFYHWRERRQGCRNHIRCGSSSGWALPYLLCWDHGKHDSIVATLSRWTCLSHRFGTDGMRVGSAILYLPPSGSPHRDRDADSVCIPCVGSEQMDLIQSALCRHTLGTEISADGIPDYLGHRRFRSV